MMQEQDHLTLIYNSQIIILKAENQERFFLLASISNVRI